MPFSPHLDPSSFYGKKDSSARRLCFILLQIIIFGFLAIIPFPFFTGFLERPAFLLIAIYHWAVFMPRLFPALAAFSAGLFLDLLTAGPLGLNALLFVAVQRSLLHQRRFLLAQSFAVSWAIFMSVAITVWGLHWAIFSIFEGALSPVWPALLGALTTSLFYPPLTWLLSTAARRFLSSESG